MTEKKVVTLNILLDGTGNNRRNDKAKGQETNVVRIGDLLKADYNFDVSKGLDKDSSFAHSLGKMNDGKIGSRAAFNDLINSKNISSGTANLYCDGVGSRGDNSWKTKYEGVIGYGADDRVKYLVNAISAFHREHPDIEIKLNIVGFSRGAAEVKDFLDKLDSKDHSHLLVNKVVLFDTVAAMNIPLTAAHGGMEMDYAESLVPHPENVLELLALNESRTSFPLTISMMV